jgi:hypothetical protein
MAMPVARWKDVYREASIATKRMAWTDVLGQRQ